mmetsp:Transcript_23827/g.66558  ORF Transcript_23827/g.66558 Transcript_23827/m.66558 type:complete len:213 (+) Transcript_23827:128-766(+)
MSMVEHRGINVNGISGCFLSLISTHSRHTQCPFRLVPRQVRRMEYPHAVSSSFRVFFNNARYRCLRLMRSLWLLLLLLLLLLLHDLRSKGLCCLEHLLDVGNGLWWHGCLYLLVGLRFALEGAIQDIAQVKQFVHLIQRGCEVFIHILSVVIPIAAQQEFGHVIVPVGDALQCLAVGLVDFVRDVLILSEALVDIADVISQTAIRDVMIFRL